MSRIVLNLGCGNDIDRDKRKTDEYYNCDIERHSGVDMFCDARDIHQFKDGVVGKIIARHIFEHFTFTEAAKVLSHWKDKLKDGGKLIIECPDFEETCRYYLEQDIEERKRLIQHLVMGEYDSENRSIHKSGWDPTTLMDILDKAGFKDIKLTWKRKCRFYMTAVK